MNDLKVALKKYRRMRGWRRFSMYLVGAAAFFVPIVAQFNQTDSLIFVLGALVVILCGNLELRLKTIQIRLAEMADEIEALGGKEPENNLALELSDW